MYRKLIDEINKENFIKTIRSSEIIFECESLILLPFILRNTQLTISIHLIFQIKIIY